MAENSPLESPESTAPAQPILLADYQPPDFKIPQVHLVFELGDHKTQVTARLEIERSNPHTESLVLDGDKLTLLEVAINGTVLEADQYQVTDTALTLPCPTDQFTLTTVCEIDPDANTALSGLYRSSGNFCTQCEPEGFRRITWFIDRPDVLSRYEVEIIADADSCPVLLSNGDLISEETLEDGRHRANWRDPWPKPSYLFALVAGDLGCLEDHFTTMSGRSVALKVYAQHHNMDQCDHAMASLQRAMRWDEAVYGREYDLDTYMIVVVDDFNMGAMENKGLNVFNSKYVLARPEVATDSDFDDIESVIGHEYFHNWSGNRVTCRDWFQLSLKEGFTVFRDQEFSADMGSRGVKRIEDVNVLRSAQFPEDAGPMAHAVRPDSYVEINNFYTVTIYNKGAEVVRMLAQLMGKQGFRDGCDLYFDRHDGQAVTTDDFVAAQEDANGRRMDQFKRWYEQAGTPNVEVGIDHDANTLTCTLTIEQNCPPTPGQDTKQPFHIPLRTALFDQSGQAIQSVHAPGTDATHEHVLELTESRQQFVLEAVDSAPVVSMLRGFSAPVKLNTNQGDEQLAVLMAHDNDAFNRWDSGQRLAMNQILKGITARQAGLPMVFDAHFTDAYGVTLSSRLDDQAFHAYALTLPGHNIVAEAINPIDPSAIHAARHGLYRHLATTHQDVISQRYENLVDDTPYVFNYAQRGQRDLKNRLLALLGEGGIEGYESRCVEQYHKADNMTDRMAALSVLTQTGADAARVLLEDFYSNWKQHALVVDKWLRLQAASPAMGTLEYVSQLVNHPAYQADNPNKIRSLFGAFSHANPVQFHRADGAGYEFLADQVCELDSRNPQVAARLIGALNQWKRYADPWRSGMQAALEKVQSTPGLSRDVGEIVNRCLDR